MSPVNPSANISPAAFSVAAAHGITAQVAATWSPDLPRDPRVMVPVVVEALVIRQAGGAWAETRMKTPPAATDDDNAVSHRTLLPDPFIDLSADDAKTRRAPGAYLHWALPDALTRGAQSADGSTTSFPAVPDRWLIVRLSPSLQFPNRRAVRGWVLQAGDQSPQPLPLATWKEPGTTPAGQQNPLTALGIGDLSWAGYFDNVENRLGVYDSLTDVREGPIAYLVCGWYSDPQLDPLGDNQVKSLTDFNAKLAQLGWALPDGDLTAAQTRAATYSIAANSVGLATSSAVTRLALDRVAAQSSLASPAAVAQSAAGGVVDFDPAAGTYTTDGSWWPQLSVYHGAVVGIGWPGVGWPGNPTGVYQAPPLVGDPATVQEEGGPPAAAAINVVVGNTMTEALARLVAQDGDAADEARILEAFQLGLLPELDKPDGGAQIDSFLHANAFGSLPGGATTEVVDEPPQSVAQAPPANPPQPGPGVFPRGPEPAAGGLRTALSPAAAVSRVTVPSYAAKLPVRDIELTAGSLVSIVAAQTPPAPPLDPGGPRTVSRALPRFFHPTDPVILLQGGKASFKHASSGRFNQEGLLVCRLTGDHATELACREPGPPGAPITYQSVKPEDLLAGGVENGSVPPECEGLLQELAVLDPGSSIAAGAIAAGANAAPAQVAALTRSFLVEQTAWLAVRDPRVDSGPLLAESGLSGRLPPVVAVTLPARPWNPIHLDWSVQFLPSLNGSGDWQLDEIDFQTADVESAPPLTFQGRSPLTQGASQTAAAAIRQAVDQIGASGGNAVIDPTPQYSARSSLSQQLLARVATLQVKSAAAGNLPQSGDVPAIDRGPLDDIASALESMDVLTGGLDGLLTDLRGGFMSDGASAPAAGAADPSPFLPFRAGFLRIVRLRLVDGFGQYLDLLDSGPQTAVDPQALLKTDAIAVPGHPELLAQPPRFTSPARLWFRYRAADDSDADASATVSPVCGFLMPNHLDGALEFFAADGTNQGVVRRVDDGNLLWEDAPGVPSTVGRNPALAVANPFCAAIAQSFIDWGIANAGVPAEQDTALAALLRVIDSTLWSVDPFGHAGDEHLSLLLGHPVAVMRAVLRLEIDEPIHPETLATLRLPVRLGALTHWQDGLLGYFVNDDYNTLFCADAAAAGLAREVGPRRGFLQQANLVQGYYDGFAADLPAGAVTGATPVTHPYIDTSGVAYVQPNQDVRLTLLVEPHTSVNVTSGLLPRKEIGMRREWVADGLAKLAPTFRFGPLLVDPQRIRMPVPTDFNGSWTWTYRADAATWAELPVTNATQDALLPPDPPSGTEGWLRLNPPVPGGSGSGGSA